MIGDDPNRIRLDKASDKRIKQVIFSEKDYTYFGKLPSFYYRKIDKKPITIIGENRYDICPFCYKYIIKSMDIWGEEDTHYHIIITHDDNTTCEFHIKKPKMPWMLSKLHKNQRY